MRRITMTVSGILAAALLLAGCNGTNNSNSRDRKITEAYSRALEAAVPYPLAQMKDSVERRNLRERLLRFNVPDKIGYVYILGMAGNYVGYYTIKGKVSSTSSQMTADQQVIHDCSGGCREVVNSMGDDGSYGPNEPGVFFFTTNGVLVETSMDFIYSDSPLPVHAPSLTPTKGQPNLSSR